MPEPEELCTFFPATVMCILLAVEDGDVRQAWRTNLCEPHSVSYLAAVVADRECVNLASFNLDPLYNWCQKCYALHFGQKLWPIAQVATNVLSQQTSEEL